MFTPVGTLIKTLPKRSKTPDVVLALHIRHAFSEALDKTCGDLPAESLGLIKASVYKEGTLTVIAPGLLKTELSMRSGGLLLHLNALLGRRVVRQLRFRGS